MQISTSPPLGSAPRDESSDTSELHHRFRMGRDGGRCPGNAGHEEIRKMIDIGDIRAWVGAVGACEITRAAGKPADRLGARLSGHPSAHVRATRTGNRRHTMQQYPNGPPGRRPPTATWSLTGRGEAVTQGREHVREFLTAS